MPHIKISSTGTPRKERKKEREKEEERADFPLHPKIFSKIVKGRRTQCLKN